MVNTMVSTAVTAAVVSSREVSGEGWFTLVLVSYIFTLNCIGDFPFS